MCRPVSPLRGRAQQPAFHPFLARPSRAHTCGRGIAAPTGSPVPLLARSPVAVRGSPRLFATTRQPLRRPGTARRGPARTSSRACSVPRRSPAPPPSGTARRPWLRPWSALRVLGGVALRGCTALLRRHTQPPASRSPLRSRPSSCTAIAPPVVSRGLCAGTLRWSPLYSAVLASRPRKGRCVSDPCAILTVRCSAHAPRPRGAAQRCAPGCGEGRRSGALGAPVRRAAAPHRMRRGTLRARGGAVRAARRPVRSAPRAASDRRRFK